MRKFWRVCVWFNFLSSAYHVLDTAAGVHKPVFSIGVDLAMNAAGLFIFGTIALYGSRAVD